MTLDGVPSPLGNLTDCDMELDDVRPPTKVTDAPAHINRAPKVSVLHRLQGRVASSEGAGSRLNTSALQFGIVLHIFVRLYFLSLSVTSCFTLCPLVTDDVMDVDVAEEDATPLKKQKVMERCKFWPVCKSGDECLYHHPTTQCK